MSGIPLSYSCIYYINNFSLVDPVLQVLAPSSINMGLFSDSDQKTDANGCPIMPDELTIYDHGTSYNAMYVFYRPSV